MSDRRDDPTPAERRTLDAVRALRRPEAPDDVRARARRAFMEGLAEPGPDAAPVPLPVRSRSRSRLVWGALLPAAAVIAVLVGYVVGMRPAAPWTVTDVVARHGVGIAHGCGNPGEHVHAGRIAVSDSSEFEIQLGQDLRIRMLPGTEVNLPAPPGRWFGRNRTLQVLSGEVYGTTAGPLGFTLTLRTPEATATLTGTTFAVFRTADATCFCLYEGGLEIVPATGSSPVTLPVGNRVFIYRDGRPPRTEPLSDMERSKLGMMSDQGMMNPLPVHP